VESDESAIAIAGRKLFLVECGINPTWGRRLTKDRNDVVQLP
jgi:hypothetical protein